MSGVLLSDGETGHHAFLDGGFRRVEINIIYFEDSDTVLVEFADNPVAETREISENIYVDLDASGSPVSQTIEHARTTAYLPDIAC